MENESTPRLQFHFKKKPEGKTLLITGGDSGIGRAVAVLFAKEGADVAIVYLDEHKDAKETQSIIEQEHGKKMFIDTRRYH